MTRVLVCGGRGYKDWEAFSKAMDKLHTEHKFSVVISGGQRGADTMAIRWARDRGISEEVYNADWTLYGRKAGPIRNKRMLDFGKPKLVVVFPGNKGTADMVKQAMSAGVDLEFR